MAIFRISMTALMGAFACACAVIPAAAPTDSLIGAWRVEDVSGMGVTPDAALTVEFSETGQVAGSTGCNRYTGAYSFDAAAGALTVTPLGVTRRLCLAPLMTQEARFVETLQGATRVETQADGAVALSAPAGGRVLMRRRSAARVTPAAVPEAPTAAAAASPLLYPPQTPNAPLTPGVAPPAADPLAPQAAGVGAPIAPPPASAGYPLAGGGAPLSPAPAPYPTPAPSYETPAFSNPALAPAAPNALAVAAAPANRITVSGEITLADDLPLPADATLRVQIRDVARADAPATVLGEQSFAAAGGPPYPFSVSAPVSVIDPRARLTLFAQVLSGNRLLYISDTSNPVPVAGLSGMSVRLANANPLAARPAAPRPQVRPAQTPASPPAVPPPAASGVIPETPPMAASAPGAGQAFFCRGEVFRIAFDERTAMLTTADGAVARLDRIAVDDDAGASRIYSNSILTVIRQSDAGGERVRFARGRAALTTCTPQ
ncbi:MAG: META domain-containing protein [Hyphomonadaceae bacterium]|nr:META domain-containing protein [Hyphomonadaceae bacterium]